MFSVPTSTQTQLEAQMNGLPLLTDLNDPRIGGTVDWAFDGADQVSSRRISDKRRGAAHARAKNWSSIRRGVLWLWWTK